jgi:DNA-binding GntR family transcriptional regulator
VQSGHLHAVRGRRGGTFVAERPPPSRPPSHEELEDWREVCDSRLATELGVAVLACRRAAPEDLEPLDELVGVMQERLEDFPAYRHADVRFHVGLAETTGSVRLVSAMTEAQGAMGALIDHIAHPPEVLAWSNVQHRELLAAIRSGDAGRASRLVTEHLEGTVHVLAGLLPIEAPGPGYT